MAGVFAAVAVNTKSPLFTGLAVIFLGGVIMFATKAAAYDVVEEMLKKSKSIDQTKSDKS